MGGLHEGKIVLTPPPADKTIEVGDTRGLYGVGKDGKPRTVLLSGCLGDFGLRLFAYVIAMGAKHILVLDRDPKRKRTVEWMRQHAYVDYLMPDSANGVSTTRSAPNCFCSPSVTRKTPPLSPTSSPRMTTRESFCISC
jgi:hypothetical protein